MYEFDYVGDSTTARWGAINVVENQQLGFMRTDHFISYLFQDDTALFASGRVVDLNSPFVLLTLSTTNSAHSICELLSFLNFIADCELDLPIAVNSHIVEGLPMLFAILQRFVPAQRLIVLNAGNSYRVRMGYVRRNIHFNATLN